MLLSQMPICTELNISDSEFNAILTDIKNIEKCSFDLLV